MGRDYPSASCYASKGLPRFSSSSVPIFRGIRARNLNFRTLEVFRGLGLEPQVIAAGSHVSRDFRKETLASAEQEEFPDIDKATRIMDHPEIVTPEPPVWYCPQSRWLAGEVGDVA